ncbi:hypothetical protein D9M68_955020 [compost metagenome]
MIVVPVLITNCQVSEYLKTGPDIAHINTTAAAAIKAGELPVNLVAALANFSKKLFFLRCDLSGFMLFCLLKYNTKTAKSLISFTR